LQPRGSSVNVGISLVLLVFGFLVATGFVQERLRERELPQRRRELTGLVQQRQETIRTLSQQVEDLSGRFSEVQVGAARNSRQLRALVRRTESFRPGAGVRALRGPGVIVQLSDSERLPVTREDVSDFRIQDVDLQLVVNALWQAGAEGVSVNEHRVAASTAIRAAGSVILVNYAAVSSPYRVAVLGNPDALKRRLEASEIARRLDVWTQVYGLGFSVQRAADLRLPALSGFPELQWAAPVDS
jgi:uncharacterized protein YlxW (UPF0749 family)